MNQEFTYPPYSLDQLQQLIDQSDAYKSLSMEEKSNIQEHIRLNNKPVLQFVYQKLQEERQSHQISRERLAKKIINLSLTPEEAKDLQQNLDQSF